MIVVPGIAMMKWVVMMMMAAKPGGEVSARRVLPVGVGVLRRRRRWRRAVVRRRRRMRRMRRRMSEVVTLRWRRHRRRSAASAADREVRIVRRGRWMDATAATHDMVGWWMMTPMIRGGWRPVAVAMRRDGRTAAAGDADAARAYSGTGFVAPLRRKRRDVVSMRRRRGRGMVHVMRTTVV